MNNDRTGVVACLSLGGTKIEAGLLLDDDRFFSAGEIPWRDRPEFARHRDSADASGLCDTLAALLHGLLGANGMSWDDVRVVGVPFPGPSGGSLWFSNNLTRAFVDGVALESVLATAIARLNRVASSVPVRVLLDAKCDAGGELYHPDGRLYRAAAARACVINVATGIAAGYACDGRILLTDDEFRAKVDAEYDAGAGQLGRHLWCDPTTGEWWYHYRSEGATPMIAPPAIRMTDYLSGPAIAARWLRQLGCCGLLAHVHPEDVDDNATLRQLHDEASRAGAADWLVPLSLRLRAAPAAIGTALLSSLNSAYDDAHGRQAKAAAETLVDQIIVDFGGALGSWRAARGWRDWIGPMVLTGGFGQRFLVRNDVNPTRSFCHRLQALMPRGTTIHRSRLRHATQREAYIFQRQ